jgi:hypothetical protein
MKTLSEGILRSPNPLDNITKDPDYHYITASKQLLEYKGYESQADYFEGLGYEVVDVDRKFLPNKNIVVMQIPKKTWQARQDAGVQETLASLDPSVSSAGFGAHPEVKMTQNEFGSQQWARQSKRRPGRPKKATNPNG